MSNVTLTVFCISVTVAAYWLSKKAYAKHPSPFTTPVFFSTALIIVILLAGGIEFDEYATARQIMTWLLGPATVALAAPLFKNRGIIRTHAVAALSGIVVGSSLTLMAVIFVAALFRLSPSVINALSVKSVTVAIAVELAAILNGNPSLAAGFVIATGMIGAMLGPWLMDCFGINHPVARGVSLGTISHGQGTAQATLEGELQGAVAGVAMGVAAVFTAVVAPLLVPLLR